MKFDSAGCETDPGYRSRTADAASELIVNDDMVLRYDMNTKGKPCAEVVFPEVYIIRTYDLSSLARTIPQKNQNNKIIPAALRVVQRQSIRQSNTRRWQRRPRLNNFKFP